VVLIFWEAKMSEAIPTGKLRLHRAADSLRSPGRFLLSLAVIALGIETLMCASSAGHSPGPRYDVLPVLPGYLRFLVAAALLCFPLFGQDQVEVINDPMTPALQERLDVYCLQTPKRGKPCVVTPMNLEER
jgi:hypothetical protein